MFCPKITIAVADTVQEIYTVLSAEEWSARSFAIVNDTESAATVSLLYKGMIFETKTLPAHSLFFCQGIATTLIEGDVLSAKSNITGVMIQANMATLLVSSGGSVAWADITGKPSTFTPSTHAHAIGDVTDLQYKLDEKSSFPEET